MSGGSSRDAGVQSAWKYNIPVAVVALLGVVLSLSAFAYVQNRHYQQADKIATSSVNLTAQRAGQSLGELRGSMSSFQGLFAAGPRVSENEFRAYASRTVRKVDDVGVVTYAPLTSAQLMSLPVQFVAPAGKSSTWQGVQLQRIPGLDVGIRSARDTGITHVEELPPGPTNRTQQLVAITPLYRGGGIPSTLAARQMAWDGVVTASLPLSAWMNSAAQNVNSSQTALTLFKVGSGDAEEAWTNGGKPAIQSGESWTTKSVLRLSEDEEYVLAGEPTMALVNAQGQWTAWLVLLAGLVLTAITSALLWRWLGARRIGETADELQQATNRLLFLAERDPLTGLPHRDGLLSWLDSWDEKNPDRPLGLCFIDLDGFKEVNTAWGHPTGDFVLGQIGKRLAVFADSQDCVVARLGGDEFVVARALDRGSLDGLATMVQTVIAEPIEVGGQEIQLTSSMGIAVRPEDGRALDTLLMNADIAVRAAKLDPNDSVVHYDPVMAAEGAAHRQMAGALRLALRDPDKHFFLQFQPQIDMQNGRLVGAEALVRWRDESGQLISPGEFIPLASEYGLMDQLGRWVLERSCETVMEWRQTCDAVVSVNVDATQLVDGFSQTVSEVLRSHGVKPEWIVLEVTESAATAVEAQAELDRLHDLGVSISIDDFGTGYSSLSRLADLPTHELKIDRAFVDGLGDSPESLEIVRTVVALAQALKLQPLAEGVETPQQARMLLAEGVRAAQGFLFSKPVSARQCLRQWQNGVMVPGVTSNS